MLIEHISIKDVRVIQETRIEPCPTFNVINGENGSGKTSLLEAIYLAGRGRTFRHPSAGPMIRNGAHASEVVVRLRDAADGRRATVGIARKRKAFEARVNGQSVHQRSVLLNCLPLVWIGSQPQALVTTGPEARRGFLDMALFHVEPSVFRSVAGKFHRVLKQRNAALRQGEISAIGSWDSTFVENAIEIDRRRVELIDDLMPRVQQQMDLWHTGLAIDFRYRNGWNTNESLLAQLKAKSQRDAQQGFTSVGPHRADLVLQTEPGPADKTLSRGQQKLLALAMQFSVLDLVIERTARKVVPVLLIDDLAAELDSKNRANIVDAISARGVQVFLTNIDSNALPDVKGQRRFHVEHGEVRTRH